jgi:Mn-containing catalase
LNFLYSSQATERSVMATDTETKPHYLDLLQEIAPGERRAGVLLKAWADKSQDPGLKECLNFVARRETSHYHIFRRRLEELGGTYEENDDPSFTERLLVNCSDMPDIEKIRYGQARQQRQRQQQQGPTRGEKIDAAIADESVDQITRDLLTWFAKVEADSGTALRKAYARVEAEASNEEG